MNKSKKYKIKQKYFVIAKFRDTSKLQESIRFLLNTIYKWYYYIFSFCETN